MNRNRLLYLLMLFLTSACTQKLDCEHCTNTLQPLWAYKLKLPFGMISKGNCLFVQNDNIGNIVILDVKQGKVKQQIECGDGAIIGFGMNKQFIVYEHVFKNKKSYITVYNYLKQQLVDSTPVFLHKDISSNKGSSIKMCTPPLIDSSLIVYALNDGSLNCYDFIKKKIQWQYQLPILPLYNSGLIIKHRYIHIQIPSLIGNGVKVLTLSLQTGKLVWEKFIDGHLPLHYSDNHLITMDNDGNILYINSADGQIQRKSIVSFTPVYCQIFDNKLAGIVSKNNVLNIINITTGKTLMRYHLCGESMQVSYSKSLNSLIVVDKSARITQFNLTNHSAKCIEETVDTFSGSNFT